MKIKLDETNLAIIKALRNGRASFETSPRIWGSPK